MREMEASLIMSDFVLIPHLSFMLDYFTSPFSTYNAKVRALLGFGERFAHDVLQGGEINGIF